MFFSRFSHVFPKVYWIYKTRSINAVPAITKITNVVTTVDL